MNKKIQSTCIGLSLAAATITSSIAGEEQSLAMTSSPSGQAYDWSWFAGGSVGYVSGEFEGLGAVGEELGLGDWDEPIYTLHIGRERRNAGEDFSHAFFLEIGYTENDESANASDDIVSIVEDSLGDNVTVDSISFSTDMEIIPITMNYKFEAQGGGKFSWYMGGGVGLALVDTDLGLNATGSIGEDSGSIGDSDSDSDTVFFGQLFAGVTYNVSETFELFGGLRYIFMDDIDVSLYDGLIDDSIDSPLDGAVHYEIGLRYNF